MSTATSRPSPFVVRLYALALRLYPAPFYTQYAVPMRQSLQDALTDPAFPRRDLFATLARDLILSLAKEHLAMLRDTYTRPALLFNTFILAGIATGVALALYAIPQQVLRTGANDPQIQLATDLAARLNHTGVTDGLAQAPLSHDPVVNMTQSLAPFLIVYTDQGQAIGSSAQLNGITPVPPRGIFDYVRQHGEERVSWQPAPGVRIAAVVERVNGPQPGFVLAGRSLREVEAREQQVRAMAGLTWLGMLALIAVGALVYGHLTRSQHHSAEPLPH